MTGKQKEGKDWHKTSRQELNSGLCEHQSLCVNLLTTTPLVLTVVLDLVCRFVLSLHLVPLLLFGRRVKNVCPVSSNMSIYNVLSKRKLHNKSKKSLLSFILDRKGSNCKIKSILHWHYRWHTICYIAALFSPTTSTEFRLNSTLILSICNMIYCGYSP